MYIRIHIYIYYIIIYLYSPKLRTKYSKTNRQITNMLPTVNPPQFPTKVQYEHPLLGFSEIGYPKKNTVYPSSICFFNPHGFGTIARKGIHFTLRWLLKEVHTLHSSAPKTPMFQRCSMIFLKVSF